MDTLVLFLILKLSLELFTIAYDISCGFVIYGLYYVEICSFYPHFAESFFFLNSYMDTVFCHISYISDFMFLGLLSFSLDAFGKRFIHFIYLFKEPALGFIDLSYCFSGLYFIYFYSDLYRFLPSIHLDFVCCSFSSFFLMVC
uniref:Uncharacterized protein n=1 Tax=Rousettus aegyptiacus TaxID=9407 RepID=A0A7J8H192_ROUAE|nr:hypothetical protein HJG63_011254 [Rousettus aegyptiacus]